MKESSSFRTIVPAYTQRQSIHQYGTPQQSYVEQIDDMLSFFLDVVSIFLDVVSFLLYMVTFDQYMLCIFLHMMSY